MIDLLSIARILIDEQEAAAALAACDEPSYMDGPRSVHVDGLPDELPTLPPAIEETDDPVGFIEDQ